MQDMTQEWLRGKGNEGASMTDEKAPSEKGAKPAFSKLYVTKLIESQFDGDSDAFGKHIDRLARTLGGGLLFELPASGLAKNCQRIAALRIPLQGSRELHTVFALLSDSGKEIRAELDANRFSGLTAFAEAFVGLLDQIEPKDAQNGH